MANIDVKPILRVGLAAQSIALLSENLKLARKKRATTSDFLKVGATNIVGAALLKEQADFIGGL